MGKALELTGETFGELLVISKAKEQNFDRIGWFCKCSCGNTKVVRGSDLKNGHTGSCGCVSKKVSSKKAKNMLDKTFSRLTVLARKGSTAAGKALWLCECTCGKATTLTTGALNSGTVQSCGCLKNKKNQERATKRKEEYAVAFTCKQCKETTKMKESRARNRIYCSKKCYNAHIYTGITVPENRAMRQTKEYREWRKTIFQEDNYTCQKCGQRGGSLNAHHIESFTAHPELRFDITNGVTLCKQCHNDFHKIYGKIGFNTEDYYEWL